MPDKSSRSVREELISVASRLFEEGRVDFFLAYERGTMPLKTTPLIARKKEDLERIWAEDHFAPNLCAYLKEVKGRVGILVKGCDSRSVISLLKEEQVKRDDVYIVGIPCPGQLDLGKVAAGMECQPEALEEALRKGPEVLVRTGGREKAFPIAKALLDKCRNCRFPKPLIYDHLLPGEYAAPIPLEGEAGPAATDELRGKTPEERWGFWGEQFQRCIRCYACRNVCPACFCPRCVVEENVPSWVSPLPTRGDNFVFHLMRLMHVAGSCTSCGECERICPMGIPLMKLNRKMAEDLKEMFDFEAGVDPEKPLPLRTFRQEDPNDFIK